ncbi:hypothetical protein [Actinomadura kijaniata]|uniref:hypothetical protein n=1 Tax=Actinomadura kijaniata TaxID=46161 RepID=UPI0008356114|nr:hypothetical protein [Actinomadura kijaniata]
MIKTLGRMAAVAALATVSVAPLAGTATAQAPERATVAQASAASHPCWKYWYHPYCHPHHHGLLDLHLGLL